MKAAKAPYNFIPLNKCVVSKNGIPDFDRYYPDRFSGYIDLEMETKTPLYIRRKSETSDFFSASGKTLIPGSSIRGMVRTLVEIVSFGKFTMFDGKKRLFYRAVADPSSLGIYYREQMADRHNNYKYKFMAGFLKNKRSGGYEIHPSKIINGVQVYRVEHSEVEKLKKIDMENLNKEMTAPEVKEIYFNPCPIKDHKHSRKNGYIYLKYAKINSICLKKDEKHPKRGYLIVSEKCGRKHMDWVINEEDREKHPLEVPKAVIDEYKSDSGRDKKNDLLTYLESDNAEKYPNGIPCFYIADEKGKIKAFGHTGFFRVSYNCTIDEHVPANLKSDNLTDFAEAIFGKEDRWATRVFFEDAFIIDGQGDVFLSETLHSKLDSPKPTSFQHYLEQPQQEKTGKENLWHWDKKEALLRGYKLYWHRNSPDDGSKYSWKAGKIQSKELIIPVKRGIKFKSRIRFENLSEEELGALMFVLDLPEGCCHKIGMGKPLGLGSIKITPKLFIIDRKKRYQSLFCGDNKWNLADFDRTQNMCQFKEAFEKYILNNISYDDRHNASLLWETPSLSELKTMLNWGNTENDRWLEKTRYMMIECPKNEYDCICEDSENRKNKGVCNEYKCRPVLPYPGRV